MAIGESVGRFAPILNPFARVKGLPGHVRGMYPGWRMVAASSVLHVLNGGLYYTGLSVFFLPLREFFDVSNTKLSLIFSLRSLEGGIDGPVAGYMADRHGPRLVVLIGVLMSGVGFILLGLTGSFLMFSIVFLGIVTIGFAFPHHGTMVTINQWFRRRLGTAISFSTSGSAVGGFALTPLVAYVVLEYGWQSGAIMSGVLVLVIGLPAAAVFRSPAPGEADADDPPRPATREGSAGGDGPGGIALAPINLDFTVGEALRTKTYWLIALGIGCRLIMKSAITVHFFPILVSKGVSEVTVVSLVALMSVLRLPAIFSAGIVGDRWSLSKMASISMSFGVMAMCVILFGPDGIWTGVLFAVFVALSQGSDAMTWGLVGVHFGRAHFGKLRGILSVAQAGFSAAGPVMVGILVDRTDSYTLAIWVMLIGAAVAGVVYWSIKAPPPPVRRWSERVRR